jgi:hypothetical protein
LGDSAVRGEIVDGYLDSLPIPQGTDVPGQKLGFKGIGVIEIELIALCRRKPAQVLVVRIMLEEGDAVCPDTLQDGLGYSGFPRTRATCDAYDQRSSPVDERVWMFHAWIIPANKKTP